MSSKGLGVVGGACVIAALGIAFPGGVGLRPPAGATVQGSPGTDVRGQWESLGPSPIVRNGFNMPGNPPASFSGRISSIAVDPTDLNHWLVGVGYGGVWESRDAGGSWIPLTDDAPTLATGDVTFDPTNPQTIYVGTGEAHGGGMAKGGVGILRSTDGGQTWTVLGASSFARGSVRRLRVNPENPGELVAASTRGGFGRISQDNPPSPPPYGVLKSTDSGQHWTRTLAGQATALEIDPAAFSHQYAGIGEDKSGQGADVVDNGVYRSTDAGQHWEPVAGPWPSSGTGRIELAMAPSNPNVVYASISQADGNRILGLYRTDNAWADSPAWRQISIAQTSVDINNFSAGSYCTLCNYAQVISVHPADPDTLFAGGKVLLWRCTNCGTAPQWKRANTTNNDTHADQHTIAWAGNRLILGNDGGIFSTTDQGATWQNHNASISTTMFYTGALHPSDPNFMIAGVRDQGVVQRNASSTWSVPDRPKGVVEWGGEGEVALSSRHPDTDWMAATVGAAIWRTTDGARTAIQVDRGIDKSGGYLYPSPVRKCPANDDVFLTGTNRLWRTDNFFNSAMPSWAENGPSGAAGTSSLIAAISFAAADATCGTYAYGTTSREIRLTRDAGRTWVDLDPGKTLPARWIQSIGFDQGNSNTVYVALSGFNTTSQGTQGRHVYKTTNASAAQPTWTNISPPDDVPFDVVVVDPRNSALVYAGGDTGLWVSGDAGATWQKVGPDRGLPHAAIYDVAINTATNQTVVFTHGRGAFRLVASVGASVRR